MDTLIESKLASAEDLFQARKSVKKLPRASGAKGYDPADSVQLAELEHLYSRQRSCLLREPRFVQEKLLYHGDWDEEKKLIHVREVGKFWTSMGFSDGEGKWLFPEEALFLMETNVMEVRLHGTCLSHQEALQLFLESGNLTLEEYAVYCHLRRNSYLVVRYQRDPEISVYAQSIRLDQYLAKTRKRRREKTVEDEGVDKTFATLPTKSAKVQEGTSGSRTHETSKTVDEDSSMEICELNENTHSSRRGVSVSVGEVVPGSASLETNVLAEGKAERDSRWLPEETLEEHPCVEVKGDSLSHQAESIEGDSTLNPCGECHTCQTDFSREKCLLSSHDDQGKDGIVQVDSKRSSHDDSLAVESKNSEPPKLWDTFSRILTAWESCVSPRSPRNDAGQSAVTASSEWNLSQVFLPDIAGKDSIALLIPKAHLLPSGVELNEELRDICIYNRPQVVDHPSLVEDHSAIADLKFSYAEWMAERNMSAIKASCWKEYKAKLAEAASAFTVHDSPASHLWQGETTPLVHPEDATCVDNILDKLKIRTFDISRWITKRDRFQHGSRVKISFNVFVPNAKFKKTLPGSPHHRVVVRRMTDPYPTLEERAEVLRQSPDGVPVHWAFVDSGSVSFYRIQPVSLPVVM